MFEKIRHMQKWKKQRLIITLIAYLVASSAFLFYTCSYLLDDNVNAEIRWDDTVHMNQKLLPTATEYGEESGAAFVKTGTYVENITNIDIKNNSFKADLIVWFKWNGHRNIDMINNFRVYKATINSMQVMANEHIGNITYQKVRINISETHNYTTPRFPLESHQLHLYIEPTYRCDQVVLTLDKKYSTINTGLSVSGFNVIRHAVAIVPYQYSNTQDDPELAEIAKAEKVKSPKLMTTEMFTGLVIERSSHGIYLKCFIALFATTIWVLITLYLASVHEVDPLGMIPGAFFGAVSNILVGANLLPDAMETGLVEFVNMWGIGNILACACIIISINSIRNRFDATGFARLYGLIMFVTVTVVVIIGNILLPLVCLI